VHTKAFWFDLSDYRFVDLSIYSGLELSEGAFNLDLDAFRTDQVLDGTPVGSGLSKLVY
jgi:hypothetical protein